MEPGSTEKPSHNAPWIFGVLQVSYGFTAAVGNVLVPYLLRKNGVPVDRIAGVVAIAFIPSVWSFLYSPLADVGLRRRSWILWASAAAALSGSAAILEIRGSLVLLTLLLFLSRAASGLVGTATGGLLTHISAAARGRAAGWSQAGNIGGGAIGAGAFIWFADRAELRVVAVAISATVMLPALAALLIDEAAPASRALGPLVRGLANDIRDVGLSARTWIGLLFFVSPAGSFAVSNLISGLGPDYHSSANEILWVSGIGGGLLAAAGSFVGGFVADRVNRMAAYSFAAALGALFALYLAFGPATPFTYGMGYSAYAFASGFSYCMFTALVLDVVGYRRHAAGTAFALLNASGNLAISYMVWLDGLGYQHGGAPGLMVTDAVANGVSALVLLGVAFVLKDQPKLIRA